MVAGMEMRPCSSSVWRRRAKFVASPSAVKPARSQKPAGACTLRSFSKARSGEAVDRARLRGDIAHGGRHGDAAVLQLRLAAAREVFRCEASQVPEAKRRLRAALVLEGAERRGFGQSLASG